MERELEGEGNCFTYSIDYKLLNHYKSRLMTTIACTQLSDTLLYPIISIRIVLHRVGPISVLRIQRTVSVGYTKESVGLGALVISSLHLRSKLSAWL